MIQVQGTPLPAHTVSRGQAAVPHICRGPGRGLGPACRGPGWADAVTREAREAPALVSFVTQPSRKAKSFQARERKRNEKREKRLVGFDKVHRAVPDHNPRLYSTWCQKSTRQDEKRDAHSSLVSRLEGPRGTPQRLPWRTAWRSTARQEQRGTSKSGVAQNAVLPKHARPCTAPKAWSRPGPPIEKRSRRAHAA